MRTELVKSLKDKLVFFDFDGTLAEFRFYNKVGPENVEGKFLYKFAFDNLYESIRPLATMQEVVKNLNPDNVYILGAVVLNSEIEQKYKWLNKNYPSIKRENMIFVSNKDIKLDMLEAYRMKYNLEYKDIVFVDDAHYTIQKAEALGFTAYHPSSFVD